ncbi:MAG: hypothetical protein HC840_00410 [Leptolyngbyaceae cyanobacterium RM2_2_4]|nr:hypothetical protein [Leptolyngbyaceae cyanobacterium RM2_2_4]
MKKKYFLEYAGMKKEVTKEEWVKAERRAGFRPKCSCEHTCNHEATGGFGSGEGVNGSIEFTKETK